MFDYEAIFLNSIHHTHTYRRRNPKVIEGYKRRKHKDYDSRAGSVLWVDPLENSIKQLQDHLEKEEDLITKILQVKSLNSDFV